MDIIVAIPKSTYEFIIKELESFEANMEEFYIRSEDCCFETSSSVYNLIHRLKSLLLEEKPCKQSQS